MSGVDMRLQMLAEFPNAVTREAIAGIESEVQAAIERLRSMLFELRPAALDREGLVPALRVYLERRAKASDWVVEVVDGMTQEPDPDMRALLYRIAQEAVANAAKHASHSNVTVQLSAGEHDLTVTVGDAGQGFTRRDEELARRENHIGLEMLRRRVGEIGGNLEIESRPGDGTRVVAKLPLAEAAS
jgi:signal transduction histidine kinase